MFYIIQNPKRNDGKFYFWDSEKQVFQPSFEHAFGYHKIGHTEHELKKAVEIFGVDDVKLVDLVFCSPYVLVDKRFIP